MTRSDWFTAIFCTVGLLQAAAAADSTDLPAVRLTEAQQQAAGLRTDAVRAIDTAELLRSPPTSGIQLQGRVVVPNGAISVVLSSVNGQLEALHVSPGQAVRPGAPLARLYSADLLVLQRDYLNAAAQAAVQAARLSRDEGLFKDGIIAASRMMDTRAAEVEAATALQEHRQLLLQAGMSGASIAALKSATQMSPRITIVARSAGTVLEQGVAVGGRVQSGDTLFRIGATGGLALELQAMHADAVRLQIGDPIAVEGCAATGRITAIGSQVDPVTQMVLVRAQVIGTDRCLRNNEYVRASATPTREGGGAVSVATAAISRIGKQEMVFVRSPDGFQPRAVTVIQSQGERSWVRAANLPAGTLVVTQGIAALKGHLQGLGASAAAASP